MMTRREWLGALAAVPAAARQLWERPFPDWDEAFAERIITDSPWAQQLTVPYRMMVRGAPGARTETYLTTRWSSALPVRQALAILEFGRERLHEPRAAALLGRQDAEYVVEVAGFPAQWQPGGARGLEQEMARSAALFVKGRAAVRAASATVPEHGMHLVATLRFPRFENLREDEGFIELTAQNGPMKIAQRFRLRDMVYRGRLEL